MRQRLQSPAALRPTSASPIAARSVSTGRPFGISNQAAQRLLGSSGGGPPAIQRKVKVDDPGGKPKQPKGVDEGIPADVTNEKIVSGYVNKLCDEFTMSGGELQSKTKGFCTPCDAAKPDAPCNLKTTGDATCPFTAGAASPCACGCLCFMNGLKDSAGAEIDWTIRVDDTGFPHTVAPEEVWKKLGEEIPPEDKPRSVRVPSPYARFELGAWTAPGGADNSAHPFLYQPWRVLAHELCGHSARFAQGIEDKGTTGKKEHGRPEHDPTVLIENKIAQQVDPKSATRGLHQDPHHGESFAKFTAAQFVFGSANVWSLPKSEFKEIELAATLAKSLEADGYLPEFDLIGHSDKPAKTPGINASLSKERAKNVKDVLHGVYKFPSNRFREVIGKGDEECEAPADQREPSCRKVEVHMFLSSGASLGHKEPK